MTPEVKDIDFVWPPYFPPIS